MHERERWQVIKAMLKQQLLVRIADVCRATGASEASVRRDFSRLAEMGTATRVRGGLEAMPGSQMASSDAPSLATRSFEISKTLNVAAKRAIARAAVALCSDGDAIIINGGTTTFEMGEFLRERRLKVLTNSYPLAETLIHHSNCRVALPGGEVYREQKLIVSPFEEDAIQKILELDDVYAREIMTPRQKQMALDLRRYLDELPVLARRNTLLYRTGKFLRRIPATIHTLR